jgi:hypothetical protein
MEGSKCPRHEVPPVVRCFCPNRLAEDLETSAYERLLTGELRQVRQPGRLSGSEFGGMVSAVARELAEPTNELVPTGGRS